MAKWIIEALVWEDDEFKTGPTVLGWTFECSKPGEYGGCVPNFAHGNLHVSEPDARAWVEDKVMEAIGATVHDPDAAWNAAIETAATEVAKWSNSQHVRLMAGELTAQELRTAKAVARGISAAIRALKRGGGDE